MEDNNLDKKIEKSLKESEIEFLNSKHRYEMKQAEINYKVQFEFNMSQEKERLEKEYAQKLSDQKAFYENELQKQRDWYEGEIIRRQEETAEWHRENTKKLLEEQRLEFENKQKEEIKIEENPKQEEEQIKEEENYPYKVSVILPIYNVGQYLKQCLNSLISQTLYDIEIICVNDGSTDDCYDILEEYKQKDGRIKVIHKENEGTGIARNTGLKVATGECIAFVDPDDWVKDNMLECLYGLIKEKDLDIAMCMPDGFDEGNQKNAPFPYFVDDNFNNIPIDRVFNWKDISPFSYPMCVWNKLYKRKFLTEHNIDFAERLDFEDHKVIFGALFYAKRIFFIREKLYVYRYNRKGSILSDSNKRLMDRMKMFDIVKKIMEDTGAYSVLKNELILYQVHDLLYYYSEIKPEFKEEYFNAMLDELRRMDLSENEKKMLCEKEKDLAEVLEKL